MLPPRKRERSGGQVCSLSQPGTSLQDGLGNQHSLLIFKSWMQISWEKRLRASNVEAIPEFNNRENSRGAKHPAGSGPYYSSPREHPGLALPQQQHQKGPLNRVASVFLQATKVCNSTITSPHSQPLQLPARQQGPLSWELLLDCKGPVGNEST